jgi:Na+/melibiose symporter-like transporter
VSLWRNRDFMKLWTGQTVSELGSRITRDGLPLAAVMVLGAGPFEMGMLRAIGGAAVLLLGLYAGVWVDRLRRRPIMVLSDIGRALLLAAIPAAALLHRLNMPLLYVVAALTGVLTVFFDVAYQTYLPSLIERENVLEGNSKLATSSSIAEIAGPGLTGILVQTLTAPIAILIDAASFLFSALTVGLIRKPEGRPERTHSDDPWHEALAGMRFIWSHPLLRALAGYAVCSFFFFGIFGSLYVVYALRDLKIGPVLLEMAILCGGVAALLGSAIARRVSARIGLGPTFIVTSLVLAVGTALIPLAHGSVVVATLFMVASQLVGDVSAVIYNVHELSLRQMVAPANVLGRVNASMRLLTFGVLPLGSLAGGLIAEPWGIRTALWIAVGGLLVSTVWLIWSPLRALARVEVPAA